MDTEIIKEISVNAENELLIELEGSGRAMYQYIYREAAGVYWVPELSSFKSTPMKGWSHSQWFNQIVSVVKSGLAVNLELAENSKWSNVPLSEQRAIIEGHDT